MIGRPDRSPDGTLARRTYSTRSPSKPALSIGADDLENLIVEAVLQRLDHAVLPQVQVADAGADVAAIEEELAELAQLRGAGTITLAEWMAARAPLLERLDVARAEAGSGPRPLKSAYLLSEAGAVRRAWPSLDFAARREIITTVVSAVVVRPAPRGRWTRVVERVDVQWRA